jgi:hypothetical protein
LILKKPYHVCEHGSLSQYFLKCPVKKTPTKREMPVVLCIPAIRARLRPTGSSVDFSEVLVNDRLFKYTCCVYRLKKGHWRFVCAVLIGPQRSHSRQQNQPATFVLPISVLGKKFSLLRQIFRAPRIINSHRFKKTHFFKDENFGMHNAFIMTEKQRNAKAGGHGNAEEYHGTMFR